MDGRTQLMRSQLTALLFNSLSLVDALSATNCKTSVRLYNIVIILPEFSRQASRTKACRLCDKIVTLISHHQESLIHSSWLIIKIIIMFYENDKFEDYKYIQFI